MRLEQGSVSWFRCSWFATVFFSQKTRKPRMVLNHGFKSMNQTSSNRFFGIWIAGVLFLVWALLYCCLPCHIWWIQQWYSWYAWRVMFPKVLIKLLYILMFQISSHSDYINISFYFILFCFMWVDLATEGRMRYLGQHLVDLPSQGPALSEIPKQVPWLIWSHLRYPT